MDDIFIAYCGLDCKSCEARIATINNDDDLRDKVANEWSILNGFPITREMINCMGCRTEGVKTPFCDKMCPIKQCSAEKKFNTCGDCKNLDSCETIKMITGHNEEALERLHKNGK